MKNHTNTGEMMQRSPAKVEKLHQPTQTSMLHESEKHRENEACTFIRRIGFKIKNTPPSRVDCINLFQQLFHIYEAMESRLITLTKESSSSASLDFFRKEPWAKR